ncbi:MAG: (Fe-S)-binding protein [Caldilineaceae bacterium]
MRWRLRCVSTGGGAAPAGTPQRSAAAAGRHVEALLPELPAGYPGFSCPAPAIGPKRGQVAFLYSCVQDAFLSGVSEASVGVLQRSSCEVHFPATQTCCGAGRAHIGEDETACPGIKLGAVDQPRFAAVISNAGGCGAALKEYDHLLADDRHYAEKSAPVCGQGAGHHRILATQYMCRRPCVAARVTYADSCHLRSAQKVVSQPRTLLRRIPGVELVELSQPDFAAAWRRRPTTSCSRRRPARCLT